MTQKQRTLTFAAISLIVVGAAALCLAGASAGEQPPSDDNAEAADRRLNRKRIDRLRKGLFGTLSKVSARERQRRKRFQTVVSTIVGETDRLVVELEKLKSSPVGAQLLECFTRTQGRELNNTITDWGIDLRSDVRRIAIAEEFFLIQGETGGASKGRLGQNASVSPFGTNGRVFVSEQRSAFDRLHAGVWAEELFVVSSDVDEIHEVIDIAEGRNEHGASTLDGISANKLIYGTLTPAELFKLLGVKGYIEPVLPLINRVVEAVDFELDIRREVVVNASLKLVSREAGTLLTAGMENLRTVLVEQSRQLENDELADLIDSVSIREGNRAVVVEWTMSLEFASWELTRCDGSED